MHIRKLSLVQFKNYDELETDFNKKLNCIVGENGVGKTNILDAIYYLCMTKSYFGTGDGYNIQYNKEFMMLKALFNKNNIEDEITCGVKKGSKKQFSKNQKEYTKLSEHIGQYPVVVVSPADSSLILDGSEERRKYINGVISQYSPTYLDNVLNYNKIIQQRNKLLKDARGSYSINELLDVFDDQLVPLARKIYKERVSFFKELQPVFSKYYATISEERESVELVYKSHLEEGDFESTLKESRAKDCIVQHTSKGIHKDDIQLLMGGRPIKRNASQGQQKTYLVSLKLAQFEFLREINKVRPILLLDDLFDKFDSRRVGQILQLVSSDEFGQIFISHHNEKRMLELLEEIEGSYAIFKVQENKLHTIKT